MMRSIKLSTMVEIIERENIDYQRHVEAKITKGESPYPKGQYWYHDYAFCLAILGSENEFQHLESWCEDNLIGEYKHLGPYWRIKIPSGNYAHYSVYMKNSRDAGLIQLTWL